MESIEQLVDIPSIGFPIWSPEGDAVAYLHDQPGSGWRLERCLLADGSRALLSQRAVVGGRPAWSPDGRWIAVVRSNAAGGSDIWLVATDGSGDERRLVGDAWESRSPSFSPNGRTVAFISGEAGSLDVWTVPFDGGEPRRLTAGTNPLDEPRWAPRWSPDGQWIAYVSSRSGERNNDDVWVVSADGTRHRQLTTGLMVNTDPAWSPDGESLAVVANTVMEHWYGDDADIWRVPFGPGDPARLTPGGGHSWRLEGAGIAWSPDGSMVYALSLHDGDKDLTAVPADGRPRTAVTNLAGTLSDFSVSPNGELLAYVLATQTSPPDLFVVPLSGGLPKRLTDCVATIPMHLTPPLRIPYRSFDGLYCDSYLYLPSDFDERKRYPGLIQVHGGGTNAYGNGWHPVEQWLARQGFVVMAVEYRGSSGYGRDFAALSYGDWGGGQTRDAVAAGEWLQQQPYISRVGIYGGSYGGYLTLHGIVAAPELFAAAVDMYGNTNKVTAHHYCDRVGRVFVARDYWGRYPEEMPELMERASTYHSLHKIKTPLLIMHGDQDKRVPTEESEQVAAIMREQGLPHRYIVYPGEGHGFRQREHRIDCYRQMFDWFATYLRA
ncbi:MAG TPA: S9 family peptidase [Thermomicrobiaceae bacterium]|nr:S9 family peptidase [Thermomicrobiaceae bacterium]